MITKRIAQALTGKVPKRKAQAGGFVFHEEASDDGQPGCHFTYNGEKWSLLWSDLESVGAIIYPDSQKAKPFLDQLVSAIQNYKDGGDSADPANGNFVEGSTLLKGWE